MQQAPALRDAGWRGQEYGLARSPRHRCGAASGLRSVRTVSLLPAIPDAPERAMAVIRDFIRRDCSIWFSVVQVIACRFTSVCGTKLTKPLPR